jgi:hypothetical protein
MKKGIIILFIALLGVSFTTTSALAGSSRGHGYKSTSITVAGCGATGYFQVHSGFSGPPMFFPFPPPFFHGTVVKSRGGCNYGHHGDHRSYRHKSYRQRNHRQHRNDRHRDNNGNRGKNRDGHRKRL